MNIINFINYCFYKIEIPMFPNEELLYDLTPLAVLVTSPNPFTYGMRVIPQETLLIID